MESLTVDPFRWSDDPWQSFVHIKRAPFFVSDIRGVAIQENAGINLR